MSDLSIAETDRVRRIHDKATPRYDRQISFFERVLSAERRHCAVSQARGEVLENAVEAGRKLRYYRAGSRKRLKCGIVQRVEARKSRESRWVTPIGAPTPGTIG